jgi:dienelactone hydrolase
VNWARAAVLFVILATAACGATKSPTAPSPTAPGLPAGFTLIGDAESVSGGTWTYRATVASIAYDLQGIVFKPRGAGRFPAVIVSHGLASNALQYPSRVCAEMVTWGLVCIATNYTHAVGAPIGAPGTITEPGASVPNVERARKLIDLLGAFGYVDMTRIAAHGHSFGAFVTTALSASYPGMIRVASHTAGGAIPVALDPSIPTIAQAASIVTPYQLHHGDRDDIVPLAFDQLLVSTLRSRGVDTDLLIYPGRSHDDMALDATMLSRVRAWYAAHGIF